MSGAMPAPARSLTPRQSHPCWCPELDPDAESAVLRDGSQPSERWQEIPQRHAAGPYILHAGRIPCTVYLALCMRQADILGLMEPEQELPYIVQHTGNIHPSYVCAFGNSLLLFADLPYSWDFLVENLMDPFACRIQPPWHPWKEVSPLQHGLHPKEHSLHNIQDGSAGHQMCRQAS